MQKKRKQKANVTRQGYVLLLITLLTAMVVSLACIIFLFMPAAVKPGNADSIAETVALSVTEPETTEPPTEPPTEYPVPYPEYNGDVMTLDSQIKCGKALLIDCEDHSIVAEKGSPAERIYPASMTKLMTLIVAIEHIDDMDATFTMTDEILEPLYAADASRAGFQSGEECTMRDLLYGAALPSGADATVALATYTAGSEAAFVAWMNEKCTELGLHDTHFVNSSGLHDPEHYSTMADIAVILDYCLQNETCKEVISTYTYTTRQTEQNPEGLTLYSTMFSRMYGDEVEGISILGGKTGFTDEAGHCLACYAETPDGHRYIAVTANGENRWHTVFDSFRLYGIITGTYSMLETEATEGETRLPQ